jgi:mono/diheme cytochrome c family protein
MKEAALIAFACGACEGLTPGVPLEQMNVQHKAKPYAASAFFADGRAMQPPPIGTVPYGHARASTGREGDAYLTQIPLVVDRTLLELGRERFDVFCAACHGLDGSGRSDVARHMDERKPPSLVAPPVVSFPPGRLYQVASEGYGLMPGYALQLTADERWAVVAYLGALQLSQAAPLDRLPEAERRAAERALGERAP